MATPIVVPGSMPTMMYLRNFADEYAMIKDIEYRIRHYPNLKIY